MWWREEERVDLSGTMAVERERETETETEKIDGG